MRQFFFEYCRRAIPLVEILTKYLLSEIPLSQAVTDTPQSSKNSQVPSVIPATQNMDPRPNRPILNPTHGHQTLEERAQEIHDLNKRLLLAQIAESEARTAATRAATA
jgi:hypothetical protein